ncbi:hypothetical protein GpartN1_g6060.t1 [Galdieria partita]|uniref:Uncharacterized protein n=1 Tax=Galdieria partita TaxID=83374 RepID=A0A9C7Q1T2_9RHOD|nr:hypothetical protein GpartN1_g6060.t1 [Galdieria partita]
MQQVVLSLFPQSWTKEQVLERAQKIQQLGVSRGLRYRCVESGQFLRIGLLQHPFYSDILEKKPLQKQRILEIGCGFAIDVAPAFIELGFELFEDKESVQSCFLVKSVGDEDFVNFIRNKFSGNPIDLVTAFQVLHTIPQYNEKVAKDVYELVRPAKGIFMGITQGIPEDKQEPLYFDRKGDLRVAHTQQSLTNMLKRAGFQRVKLQFLDRNTHENGWTGETDTLTEMAGHRQPLAFIAFVE